MLSVPKGMLLNTPEHDKQKHASSISNGRAWGFIKTDLDNFSNSKTQQLRDLKTQVP